MAYDAEQLARLASLAGALLDVPVTERAGWLATMTQAHPDLARSLAAMAAADTATPPTGPVMTILVGDGAHDDTGHRPDERVGPYRLERQLGAGGMGTVWLAEQVDGRMRRKAALKLLRPGLTHPGWRLRFERERDVLAGMDHPGIARLFEAGTTADGQPFLAMQYVAGDPLGRHAERRRLRVADRVRLVVELLGAVQHAHALLVIHRDLKPGNILVDEAGRVVLLDFGIAKPIATDLDHDALTELAGTALTLDYASPEQVAGRTLGIGTDIYSLGVVLYELLCGQRPYRLKRGSRAEMEQAILEQDLQPPSRRVVDVHAAAMGLSPRALARQLRGDLDTIVLKALRREVGERYATADALADDLRRWLDGHPVAAQRRSAWYLTRRFVQRQRWAVAGAALTVAGLATGLGIALWQAGVAREQARAAQASEAFLKDLFEANSMRQADPARAQQTTARELLDLGAERIAVQLRDAPEVRIRLLGTLADLYEDLLVMEPALRMRQEAARLRQQLHPGPTRERASDLIALAGNGNMLLPRTVTTGYLQQAREILDALGDHTSPLRGQLEVQQAQQAMADRRRGAELASGAVRILRPHGPTALLADALVTLAVCQAELDDPAQALATAREALQLVDKLHLEAERPTLWGVVARSQSRLGQLEASIASARAGLAAVAGSRTPDAPPNSAYFSVAMTLAGVLADNERPRDALAVLDELLQSPLLHEGDLDRYGLRLRFARALSLRGKLEVDLGDIDAGGRDMSRAGQLLTVVPASEGQKSEYLDRLAAVLLAQGQLGEAQCRLNESSAIHQRLQHVGTRQINEHVVVQARLLIAAGQGAQAMGVLEQFRTDPPADGQPSPSALALRALREQALAGQRDANFKAAPMRPQKVEPHPGPGASVSACLFEPKAQPAASQAPGHL